MPSCHLAFSFSYSDPVIQIQLFKPSETLDSVEGQPPLLQEDSTLPCMETRQTPMATDASRLPPPRWKGSQDAWLEAGLALLLESGVDSVRILPLAKRLGVSRTSFYWFFKDRDALLDALMTRWRNTNTPAMQRQTEAYADTIVEATLNVFDCWLDPRVFDAKLEFAIRSWGLQSPAVAEHVNEADEQRVKALTAMFERFGYPATNAGVRARTLYLTQIGYISMKTDEPLGMRMQRIPDYIDVFTGCTAQPRELSRFHARHGYCPDR